MTANDWIIISSIGTLGAIPTCMVIYHAIKEWFIRLQQDNSPQIDFEEYENTLDRLEFLEMAFAIYKENDLKSQINATDIIRRNFEEVESRLKNLEEAINIAEKNDTKIAEYVDKLEQTYDRNFKILEEKQRLIMDI